MIFARKIYQIPEFYMIFARKMPEFYIIIALKIFFPNFRGAHAPPRCPPYPTPMFIRSVERSISVPFPRYNYVAFKLLCLTFRTVVGHQMFKFYHRVILSPSGHMTSSVTWPFDSTLCYRLSVWTNALSRTVNEILIFKDSGVVTLTLWGHETSSVTWPLDSQCIILAENELK